MKQSKLSRLIALFFLAAIWSDYSLMATADPLHDAAQRGDLEEAQSLIEKGADINAPDENGLAALHHAAMRGHGDMVALITDRGANVNVTNQDGWTPLRYAIFHGKKDVVEVLIARGADVDIKEKKDKIPLFLAMERDRQDIALLLVNVGADIHATADRGETLLHRAALLGHCEVAKALLDRGFDVNLLRGYGWTPLHRAVRGYVLKDSHVDMVKLLVARGAAIDKKDVRGCTPLNIATESIMISSQGEPPLYRIVKFLISEGADINSKSRHGWPALHWAVGTAQKDFVELLISKGAEIDSTDWNGNTPLHWAVKKHRESRESLATSGVNIKVRASGGSAAANESLRQSMASFNLRIADTMKDVAVLLIAKGADVNAKNKDGDTPLIEAAKGADLEIVKLLVAGGADVNAKGNNGVTPLQNAARYGRADILELLSATAAQGRPSDKASETLLLLAAQSCKKDTAKLLIAKGADVNAKNEFGVTPLGLAIGGHREAKELPEAEYSPDYVKRGDYFYRQNEYDRAIEDYTTAIQLFQSNEDAYVGRGRAWVKKGDSKRAASDWKKAVELHWATALDIYYHRHLLKPADAELDRLMQEAVKQHLSGLKTVAGYAVGPSLVPAGFYTISLILSEPFDEDQFLEMARNDNPVIRAMALICLARQDSARYEETIRSFYTDRAEVEYLPYGCILTHTTLGELASSILEHPNRLDAWSPFHAKRIANATEADSKREDTETKRTQLVEALISEGADVNVGDKRGETPLHYAAQRRYRHVAKLLIADGAQINASSNSGETPLHCATRWGYSDVVELLIANGANVNLPTKHGSNALAIAKEMGYQELSSLLRESGAED
ncbi:MAG: ankyrin repeat domain-containing protein [Planctomycetota bacterium]